ncbi:hypothetical protein [Anaerococcus sp. AGMB09787]|uniref:hypothetical protein n=1 Tax=Anaerococcus sp. AGMB09787 TaxID=2922869 RepID=UPI001FB014F8|nr:hypothetical protein [Anaerococcus sp. AGMB09787]
MKVFNLQRDILRAMIKSAEKRTVNEIYFDEDDKNFYVGDLYRLYKIPKDMNFLDYRSCERKPLKGFLDDKGELINLVDVGLISREENGDLRLLKSGNFDVWVNNSFFKYLGSPTQYKTLGNGCPVLCYQAKEVVACLCPVEQNYKVEIVKNEG